MERLDDGLKTIKSEIAKSLNEISEFKSKAKAPNQ